MSGRYVHGSSWYCSVTHWAPSSFDARPNAVLLCKFQSHSMPRTPMQYATQTKKTLWPHLSYIQMMTVPLIGFASMVVRKRRHKIDAPGPVPITAWSGPRRKRSVHAHASRTPVPSYRRPMTLPVRIEIFPTSASIPVRRVVSVPIALRSRVRMRAIRVRVPRRRRRGGGRSLRACEGDIIPHSTASAVYRARAALWR